MQDFARVSYAPVGRCIYCRKVDDLRKEHIIPYALGSNTSLPKATCGKCAEITGKFEQQVMRGPMWPVRVLRKLQSRTKHNAAATTEQLTIVKDGQERLVELPLEEFPILLPFPIFPLPAILSPAGYTSGIQVVGEATVLFGPRPDDVARELGASRIKMTREHHPGSFARMLAKIAYSYAFGEGVTHVVEGNPPVIASILGEKDEIGFWVGTTDKPLNKIEHLLHRLSIIEDKKNGLLAAEVQLFADSQTPSYFVVLGRLQ